MVAYPFAHWGEVALHGRQPGVPSLRKDPVDAPGRLARDMKTLQSSSELLPRSCMRPQALVSAGLCTLRTVILRPLPRAQRDDRHETRMSVEVGIPRVCPCSISPTGHVSGESHSRCPRAGSTRRTCGPLDVSARRTAIAAAPADPPRPRVLVRESHDTLHPVRTRSQPRGALRARRAKERPGWNIRSPVSPSSNTDAHHRRHEHAPSTTRSSARRASSSLGRSTPVARAHGRFDAGREGRC
jgi:hypothetical protein